jgi:SAM-dependent methyltransferase
MPSSLDTHVIWGFTMSDTYYREKLSAARLRRVYDVASPRVKQYLQAEVDFVLSRMKRACSVLELGCGYGRIIPDLAAKAGIVFGIDNSQSSIDLAK